MNNTILKFNYPESLIKEYEYWVVLVRNEQVTLGSLILAYKKEVGSFSEVNKEGFLELETIIKDIEITLKKIFNYDKINYLTLMMLDKEVHTHIIPRYSKSKKFKNKCYLDLGWPGPPDLKCVNELNKLELSFLTEHIKNNYNGNH
jgi:diadenosine tetraphosphate (Ap4A) HIT family hydrolase